MPDPTNPQVLAAAARPGYPGILLVRRGVYAFRKVHHTAYLCISEAWAEDTNRNGFIQNSSGREMITLIKRTINAIVQTNQPQKRSEHRRCQLCPPSHLPTTPTAKTLVSPLSSNALQLIPCLTTCSRERKMKNILLRMSIMGDRRIIRAYSGMFVRIQGVVIR